MLFMDASDNVGGILSLFYLLVILIFSISDQAIVLNLFVPYVLTRKIIGKLNRKEKILTFIIGLASFLTSFFGPAIFLTEIINGKIGSSKLDLSSLLLGKIWLPTRCKPLIELLAWILVFFSFRRFGWPVKRWYIVLKTFLVINFVLLSIFLTLDVLVILGRL